jgi:6-pyruvoyltetrahydropterin/6-carboxytetrahydropterin synthase
MIDVTHRYSFSASHRLHSDALSEAENSELFGKCNNPFGHGHNYEIFVTARGPLDLLTGRAFAPETLDRLVSDRVLAAYDHKYMNAEVLEFAEVVPTTENVALAIAQRLKNHWTEAFPTGVPRLRRILIRETDRNVFELNL